MRPPNTAQSAVPYVCLCCCWCDAGCEIMARTSTQLKLARKHTTLLLTLLASTNSSVIATPTPEQSVISHHCHTHTHITLALITSSLPPATRSVAYDTLHQCELMDLTRVTARPGR